MIRVTSATHSATCAACRDKAAINLTEPCVFHAAQARGLRVTGWRPSVVAAWDAQPTPTDRPPADGVPTAWDRLKPIPSQSLKPTPSQPVDAWKAFR